MKPSPDTRQQMYGLFELDASGRVLYSHVDAGAASDGAGRNITGRNFFDHVGELGNVEELRRLIGSFIAGRCQTESFDLTCEFEQGALRSRVLLARIRDRSDGDRTKAVLVNIKRAETRVAGRVRLSSDIFVEVER